MTKSDEIQILREAAAKLGSQSYCGPWLAEQLQFIESAMRSDIEPGAAGLSWSATWDECAEMKRDAEAYAKETRENAEKEAHRAIEAALTRADRIRADLKAEIERAERVLGSIAERL
jgi:cell division septum initiation protein DivIVA